MTKEEREKLFKDLETVARATSEMLETMRDGVDTLSDMSDSLKSGFSDGSIETSLNYVGRIARYSVQELTPFVRAGYVDFPKSWKEALQIVEKHFLSEQPEWEKEGEE